MTRDTLNPFLLFYLVTLAWLHHSSGEMQTSACAAGTPGLEDTLPSSLMTAELRLALLRVGPAVIPASRRTVPYALLPRNPSLVSADDLNFLFH